MALPPGFIDELRTRLSLSDVVGRKVMWDRRKSQPSKGDHWAPCPFHHEKTASFHVDDRKGYYYCFGCHAKGDAITFVRETENVGFMEAVKILAGEAGMQVPEQDPASQQKADRASRLREVMEMAERFYQLQLRAGVGAAARAYLEKRGLDADAQGRWGLGYAPGGWQTLFDALTAKGVDAETLIECGLAKASDRGRKPYDVFRDRILFPIRDAQGRTIAFGGRAMDPSDGAKYLNSPETPLFDKSRTLYNLKPARAAAKDAPLIVAEGYMDVIALSEAGFPATVAPLGTAVTETQMQMLWRIADEPVVALDGDTAGLRAAHRVVDLALPLLAPGKTLNFAILPDGQDPDDLLKAGGKATMEAVLAGATPLVRMLFERERAAGPVETPEQKAGFDKRLAIAVARIADEGVRGHYKQAVRDLRWQAFRKPPAPRAGRGVPNVATPAGTTKAAARALETGEEVLRERMILGLALRHPVALAAAEDALDRIDFLGEGHAALAAAMLAHGRHEGLAEACRDAGCGAALESLAADRHLAIHPAARAGASDAVIRETLEEQIAKLTCERGLRDEMEEFAEGIDVADERDTWRLDQAARAREKARRADVADATEYETAPNGAAVDRAERARLDALLGRLEPSRDEGRR
ncbi:MAG: DNA primase [Shimia sp.]